MEDNVVYQCLIEAPPAQETDQSSVSPRLRGGKEEEEDSGEEGWYRVSLSLSLPHTHMHTHTTIQGNLMSSEHQHDRHVGWLLVSLTTTAQNKHRLYLCD